MPDDYSYTRAVTPEIGRSSNSKSSWYPERVKEDLPASLANLAAVIQVAPAAHLARKTCALQELRVQRERMDLVHRAIQTLITVPTGWTSHCSSRSHHWLLPEVRDFDESPWTHGSWIGSIRYRAGRRCEKSSAPSNGFAPFPSSGGSAGEIPPASAPRNILGTISQDRIQDFQKISSAMFDSTPQACSRKISDGTGRGAQPRRR